MNTEEKELLLKDLCARLPYGVQIAFNDSDMPHRYDWKVWKSLYYEDNRYQASIRSVILGKTKGTLGSEIKPVYFPIECLTKPITIAGYNDGKPFVPMDKLDINMATFRSWPNYKHYPMWIIEKLNEWHINYRLPAHLFVPVTETFNPYSK